MSITMAISYRLASYLTSIICNSIISTTLICSLISPLRLPFSPSTSTSTSTASPFSFPSPRQPSPQQSTHWIALSKSSTTASLITSSSSHSYSSSSNTYYFFSLSLRSQNQEQAHRPAHGHGHGHGRDQRNGQRLYSDDFDYGSNKARRDLYNREETLRSRHRRFTHGLRSSRPEPPHVYLSGPQQNLFDGSEQKGFVILSPGSTSSASTSASVMSTSAKTGHRRIYSYQHQHHWDRSAQRVQRAQCHHQKQRQQQQQQHYDSDPHSRKRSINDPNSSGRRSFLSVFNANFGSTPNCLPLTSTTTTTNAFNFALKLILSDHYRALQEIMDYLIVLLCDHYFYDPHHDDQGLSSRSKFSQSHTFCSNAYASSQDPRYLLDTSRHIHAHPHAPQRLTPHPVIESLASNLLVRTGLLIILCLGAFYYCVTVMEQHQIVRAAGSAAVEGEGDHVGNTSSSSSWWPGSPVARTVSTFRGRSSNSRMSTSSTNSSSNASQASAMGIISSALSESLSTTVDTTTNAEVSLNASRNNEPSRISTGNVESSIATGRYFEVATNLISAVIRSSVTTMALTYGTEMIPAPYSASTTPLIHQLMLFKAQDEKTLTVEKDNRLGKINNSVGEQDFQKDSDPKKQRSLNSRKDKDKEEEDPDFIDHQTFKNPQPKRSSFSVTSYPQSAGESSRSNSRRSSVISSSFTPSFVASSTSTTIYSATSFSDPSTSSTNVHPAEKPRTDLLSLSFCSHFYNMDALRSTLRHRFIHARAAEAENRESKSRRSSPLKIDPRRPARRRSDTFKSIRSASKSSLTSHRKSRAREARLNGASNK